jgi:hypothetical protein
LRITELTALEKALRALRAARARDTSHSYGTRLASAAKYRVTTHH